MPAFPFEYVIRSPFAAYYGWKRLKGTQLSFGQSAFPRGGQLTEYSTPVAAINTTSGLTVTTDQLFGVIYNRDCNGAIRSDATPTAAAIVAAMKGCMVGDKFDWVVYNSVPARSP